MEIIKSSEKPGISEDVKDVMDKFDAAKDARQTYEKRWLRNYMLARNYRNRSKYPFRSNLFIPMIFAIIHDQLPAYVESAFAGSPVIGATALNLAAQPNEKNVEDVLTYDFKMSRLRQKYSSWILQTLIFGTGIMKLFYRFEVDAQKTKILYDGPDCESLDCLSFYPDPSATVNQPMRYWIQHKVYPDLKTLKAEDVTRQYINLNKLDGGGSGQSETDYRAEYLASVKLGYNVPSDKNIEIFEIHDLQDGTVMTVANKSVIIRERAPLPYPAVPPAILRNYEIPFEFWGMGEPEYLEPMQHALNTMVNQGIDNRELFNNKGFMAEVGALANPGLVISRPGMILDIAPGRIGDVKEIPISGQIGDMQPEQQIQNWMRVAATGEHSLSAAGQRKTATEQNYAAQKEAGRTGHKNFRFEQDGPKAVAEGYHVMRKAFIGSGMPILKEDEKTGEKYPWLIRAQDLEGEFEFEAMGSKMMATKKDKQDNAERIFKLFTGNVGIDQTELNRITATGLEVKDVGALMAKQPQGMPGQAPGLPDPAAMQAVGV